MPLSRRYTPEHPPGESCLFGMNFDYVIPPGVGIVSAALAINYNRVPPTDASADWKVGALQVRDKTVYATLSGGVDGTDYQLVWTATDTDSNVWPRVGLVLCAATS